MSYNLCNQNFSDETHSETRLHHAINAWLHTGGKPFKCRKCAQNPWEDCYPWTHMPGHTQESHINAITGEKPYKYRKCD